MVIAVEQISLSERAGRVWEHTTDPNVGRELQFMRDNACFFCHYLMGNDGEGINGVCMGPITRKPDGTLVILVRHQNIERNCRLTDNTEVK